MNADPSEAHALELRSVTAGYDRTTVLRDVDLAVPVGTVTVLLGPNGAGKTTLLKVASGLVRPTAGSVHLFGDDVTAHRAVQRSRRGLCHIPEGRAIFRSLSVRENLELQARPGQGRDAIERSIAAFPILGERLRQTAGTLSGGQQQMLAMSRAYVQDPRLVLVDEASLGLAPIIVDEIFAFLAGVVAEGTALLLVDQFAARALGMATRAYVLNKGTIVYDGTAADLRERDDLFAQYLGGEPEQAVG